MTNTQPFSAQDIWDAVAKLADEPLKPYVLDPDPREYTDPS